MPKARTILNISIALNIFLLGSIGGAALWIHDSRMIMAGSLRVAGSELPSKERSAFRKILRDARHDMAQRLTEAREARRRAAELLRQPTINGPEMTVALDQARSAEVAVRAEVESRAIRFVAAMPLSDRKILADAIERRGSRTGRDED